MLSTIIIVSMAYAWLLKETNFLRIHLLVGKLPVPKQHEPKVTRQQINDMRLTWNISPAIEQPLCSWLWLRANQWFKYPPCYVELRLDHTTHKITVPLNGKGKDLVKEIMSINTKPHKVKFEAYPPSHYAELGLGCWRSTILKHCLV